MPVEETRFGRGAYVVGLTFDHREVYGRVVGKGRSGCDRIPVLTIVDKNGEEHDIIIAW